MRCGACSSNTSTVAGFETSTTSLKTVSHRGVALLRLEHHWPSSLTVASSTMHVCPCKRRPLWAQTVTDVFVYELLKRLFHIGNFCFWVPFLIQLLLRICAVDFVEICNVYIGKMTIKAAKRILNSDKIYRGYSDLNFGVTFLEHSVFTWIFSRCLVYSETNQFKFCAQVLFANPYSAMLAAHRYLFKHVKC